MSRSLTKKNVAATASSSGAVAHTATTPPRARTREEALQMYNGEGGKLFVFNQMSSCFLLKVLMNAFM